MATSKEITSLVNLTAAKVSATSDPQRGIRKYLYITSILIKNSLTVTLADGSVVSFSSDPGPVSLPSPIMCLSFTPAEAGQVAYYEQ